MKINREIVEWIKNVLLTLVILYIPLIGVYPILLFSGQADLVYFQASPVCFPAALLNAFICRQLFSGYFPFTYVMGYGLLFVLVAMTIILMKIFRRYKLVIIILVSCCSFYKVLVVLVLASVLMGPTSGT
jgi:hypothetical protein